MNTYKWVCKGCETPNIFVHDPEEPGQVALNCKQCGSAGELVEEEERIVVRQVGYADYASTEAYNPHYGSPDRIGGLPPALFRG
jgi:hypothetical protein